MAPAGASFAGEYREQGAAVRASHCGDGGSITVLRGRQRKRTSQAGRSSGSIEVEIDGMTIRIGRGAEAKTVAAVLRALKAAT